MTNPLEKLRRVDELRHLAAHWKVAGNPATSSGPSWWERQEESLKAAIALGYSDAATPEQVALQAAFQCFKQQIYAQAAAFLLLQAQSAVGESRAEAQRILAICDDVEAKRTDGGVTP